VQGGRVSEWPSNDLSPALYYTAKHMCTIDISRATVQTEKTKNYLIHSGADEQILI